MAMTCFWQRFQNKVSNTSISTILLLGVGWTMWVIAYCKIAETSWWRKCTRGQRSKLTAERWRLEAGGLTVWYSSGVMWCDVMSSPSLQLRCDGRVTCAAEISCHQPTGRINQITIKTNSFATKIYLEHQKIISFLPGICKVTFM